MTPSQPLSQWPKWRDTLIYRLRMKDVPGDQIGDILLEVDTHLQESGETPDEAFGNARTYADSRATDIETPVNPWSILSIVVGSFAGAALTVGGALQFGKGVGTFVLLPPWLALVLGLVLVAGTLVTLPIDLVRHPVSGRSLLGDVAGIKWVFGGGIAIAAIVFYVLGRMLA